MSTFQDKYAKRYAQESQVNVYYLPMHDTRGRPYYFYVIINALLQEQFERALELDQIPDFAVVVRQGPGHPSDEIKAQMKKFYGFDHDLYDQQLAEYKAAEAS